MCPALFLRGILLWNLADWGKIPPVPYPKSACKGYRPIGSSLAFRGWAGLNFTCSSVSAFVLKITDSWCCSDVNSLGFPGGLVVKNLLSGMGDMGSIPNLGRSPWEGISNTLQYSFLENPMDREAWWATVHGITKSRTWLSNWTTEIVNQQRLTI